MPTQHRRSAGAALALPPPPLRDSVVALRPWRAGDVPERLMAFAGRLVQRFSWARVSADTEADARAFLAAQERGRREGGEISFALVAPGGDAVVLGGASLHEVDRGEQRAAVGYRLAAHAHGRGVASHAVRLLAAWSFERLGVARLELTCAPDNTASQAVAERCGFTREGVLRTHLVFKGARRDTVMYSLLPGELR